MQNAFRLPRGRTQQRCVAHLFAITQGERASRARRNASRRATAILVIVERGCKAATKPGAAIFPWEEKWPMGKTRHRPFNYVDKKGLVGQSLSALCTSSLQNVSAVSSLQSLSETMLLLSLALFGLVSSEHNGTSLMLESEAYRPQDTMHAFYSDSIYYIREEGLLSSVFFILGKIFSFFSKNVCGYGVFSQKRRPFCGAVCRKSHIALDRSAFCV